MALDIEEDTIIAAGPMAGFLNTGKRLAVVSCLVLPTGFASCADTSSHLSLMTTKRLLLSRVLPRWDLA